MKQKLESKNEHEKNKNTKNQIIEDSIKEKNN